jgi:hypothetical protein
MSGRVSCPSQILHVHLIRALKLVRRFLFALMEAEVWGRPMLHASSLVTWIAVRRATLAVRSDA